MAAQTQDRKIRSKWTGRSFAVQMAAAAVGFGGAACAVQTDGYSTAAAATGGLRVMGLFLSKADNTDGSDGDIKVTVQSGVFFFKNDATNPITQADQGKPCYVKDDQTVQDEGGGSPVIMGIVDEVASDGVWVYVGPEVGLGLGVSAIETVAGVAAISVLTRTSLINADGGAKTLANGLYEGQRKSLRVSTGVTSTVITPATFADGTTITVDAVNDFTELEWHDATGWNVVTNISATVA